MRLHHLELTAFGPFAGTQTVDFDALGADGLFLLHGPTGAGKTSVLDAVAFALFGRVPGARAEGRRLRSDHAAPGVGPSVTLELSVGGRRVRIVRRPEWQRPKKRGSGTTKEQASASLTWLDEPGSEGPTRIDEVGRAVETLLGMSADQFFQVVLLPQGEFAKFLRAGTDERAGLLARLFATDRFHACEDWLAQRRRTTAVAAEAGRHEVDVLVGSIATAAGSLVEPEPAADAAADGDEPSTAPLVWAAALGDRAQDEERATSAALAESRAEATDADQAQLAARELAGLLARRDRARRALADLAADADLLGEARERAAAARRALPVAEAGRDAGTAVAVAASLAAVVTERTEGLESDLDGAAAVEGDVAAACDAWRTEVGRLGELVDLAATAAVDEQAARALTEQMTALDVELARLAASRAELPGQVRAAEADLVAARRAADGLAGVTQARDAAAEVAAAAAEVPGRHEAAQLAEAARSKAVTAHQVARQYWLDLREARIDGIAAELAGELELDAACVVCGSTVHPAPAMLTLQTVNRADEEVAHEVEQAAVTALEKATAHRDNTRRELAAVALRSGGADPDAAGGALAELDVALRCSTVQAATVPALQSSLAELRVRDSELAATDAQHREERAAARERRDGLCAGVTAARARLEAARGEDSDVTVRRARLADLADRADALLEARGAAEVAQRGADAATARAVDLAAAAGFADLGAAAAAELDPVNFGELECLVAQAHDTETTARATLTEPAVAALPEDAVADVAGPAERCRAAGERLAAAQDVAARCRHRAEQLADLLDRLTTRLARLAPVIEEADRVAALADVVAGRGQNRKRVSLHSYVLAARLEEVAAAASVRLRRMSEGRYEFVHTDAAGPRGTRGGLGLDVRDDYTGVVRAASTLSGGESFLASLALALGLADVVAAESGGVLLDTLFVDEGFGTLDADTLEQVMTVLDELRAGGRVVGLVSHVDELRQRIPSRLHVQRARQGSALTVVAG